MKKDFILGVIVATAVYSYGALWLYVIYPILLK
jgi:hypothetical protein